ncbi:MAG TPA: serine--tRNA ligase [Acidimicrobiales bacterium]|nr:serine--tRNA ligase [Acidimicrobiales bacterium]
MIDIRRIRNETDAVKAALARRGLDGSEIDRLLEDDAASRRAAGQRDYLRARIKDLSRQVGALRRAGDSAGAEAAAAESRALGEDERRFDAEADAMAAKVRDALLVIPNLPAEDAPDGASEADNRPVRWWSSPVLPLGEDGVPHPERHQSVPHWDIGTELGILDLERGAKLSGSMFPVYRGLGARLLRALINYSLDQQGDDYEEIRPPTLVRTETMISTGHLPKFIDDAYHFERDDLWAIPTAEVPLTSMARDEILNQADLPMRLTAYTPCFRREAGSAGRDTRGLLRVHEFDKVELLAYATPEQAADIQADMLARSEAVLQALGLTYRVVDLCTGDLGQSAARTFDLEAYAPGCGMWLEVSSVSWFSDYQARRANVRYRPTAGGAPAFVHTLNGSAMGWPRTWAALVETHHRADGGIDVPEVLRPMVRADVISAR